MKQSTRKNSLVLRVFEEVRANHVKRMMATATNDKEMEKFYAKSVIDYVDALEKAGNYKVEETEEGMLILLDRNGKRIAQTKRAKALFFIVVLFLACLC